MRNIYTTCTGRAYEYVNAEQLPAAFIKTSPKRSVGKAVKDHILPDPKGREYGVQENV
jgi:hypothetical protein